MVENRKETLQMIGGAVGGVLCFTVLILGCGFVGYSLIGHIGMLVGGMAPCVMLGVISKK